MKSVAERISDCIREINRKDWEEFLASPVHISEVESTLKILYLLKDYGMDVEKIESEVRQKFYEPLLEAQKTKQMEITALNAKVRKYHSEYKK